MIPDEREQDIRDGFAAHALMGLLSGQLGPTWNPSTAARRAYDYAAAMMIARQEPRT